MKKYKRLYQKICSEEYLEYAYKRARKGKSKKLSVLNFDSDKENNLKQLREELITRTYFPLSLKRFVVRDPKTRTIHASSFRDRIVHHLIVNALNPIYEKIFIYDSFASRKEKGVHPAIERLDFFKRKVSSNGKLIKNSTNNNFVQGYALKADILHYFDNVDHKILIDIIQKKVQDKDFVDLVKKVLLNFDSDKKDIGMPLGNYTSQFFANVYLNELDYFVKHTLKAKYYFRYVDDFVILHKSRKRLEFWKREIENFLEQNLKLRLHPQKSKIISLSKGLDFVGFRNFYHYKLLRKRNIRKILREIDLFKNKEISKEKFEEIFQGWEAYAKWANAYKLRKRLRNKLFRQLKLKQ